jgi:protein involved in polysaccharide export with SLBB domain
MKPCIPSRSKLFVALGLFVLLAALPSCNLARKRQAVPISYPTAPLPVSVSKTSAQPASIQPGDTLEILVLEDRSFNETTVVRESGDIILPKVGRVRVVGLSLSAAETVVQKRIQQDQIKEATVIVDRTKRLSQSGFAERPKLLIFLTGAINRGGQHLIALTDRDGVSAYEALLIGGGPSPYGDTRRAYILRKVGNGQRQRIPLDLRTISQGIGFDPMMQQGDVLHVPERRFGF